MLDNLYNIVSHSTSQDDRPWSHPCLKEKFIADFRNYSESIWNLAMEQAQRHENTPLNCAFSVNMAQNMYKWARMAKELGHQASLYLHPGDQTALSTPQWEEFDGEFHDLLNGEAFLDKHANISLDVPSHCVELDETFNSNMVYYANGKRHKLLRMLAEAKTIRHEALAAYPGVGSYFNWAKAMASHDVIYTASMPVAAYLSGRPYSVFSVGGDVQFDCGKGNWYGALMSHCFNSARFILISNPHTLGHCRRLGFTNGLYLPYPMDTERYCPGTGKARSEWISQKGDGIYVLTSARLDSDVKGHTDDYFQAIAKAVAEAPQLKFVFLHWGNSADNLAQKVGQLGLSDNVLILPPVGKKRLIDYYRSCDVVLDQFVYGYYGTTALEAASIGKPVVMHLREKQYHALYKGDIMPAENAKTPREMLRALVKLAQSESYRKDREQMMRQWVIRNHGQDTIAPLMMALLRLTANSATLPEEKDNPLWRPLSPREKLYHRSCKRKDQC